jgi:hydrogenase-4 membrane subunit HyfE
MTPLLLALLVALLLPFFMSGWRANLAALGAQGLLMGWLALRREPLHSPESALAAFDLFVSRGVLVPWLLWRAMHARDADRGDVVAPNMLSWALVAALVAVAFRFAGKLEPVGGEAQTALAVAAAGLLLGLFALAHQTGVFSQAAAALRVENAIALFELTHESEATPFAVEIGLAALFVATGALYAFYVRRLSVPPEPEPADARAEEPAL